MDDSDPESCQLCNNQIRWKTTSIGSFVRIKGASNRRSLPFCSQATQFLLLGLEHIFTGYDHILFVISLLFGAKTFKNILSLVTAFTIAHSITLILATLEIVQLPGRFVETAIALSIIYVALINIFNPDSKHTSHGLPSDLGLSTDSVLQEYFQKCDLMEAN